MTAMEPKIVQAVKPDVIQLVLPAQSKYLAVISRITKAIAQLSRLDSQGIEDLRSAVVEACLNVVQHAYPKNRMYPMREELIVRFLIYPTKLEVVVKDMGYGFDQVFAERYISRRDVGKPARLKMGLHIIKKSVDEIEIDSRIGEGTQIRMTKYLPAVEDSSGDSASED